MRQINKERILPAMATFMLLYLALFFVTQLFLGSLEGWQSYLLLFIIAIISGTLSTSVLIGKKRT